MPDKSSFRATLSFLWLVMNSFRLIFWYIAGEFEQPVLLKNAAIILPFMLCGLLIGDYLHHKVDEKIFKIGVYSLLTISGIIMFINNIMLQTGQR